MFQTRAMCTLCSIAIVLAGCASAVVVGGGTVVAGSHVLHCYGLGMVNNCPGETPPEILARRAAEANDLKTLKELFEANSRIYRNSEYLEAILSAAIANGSEDALRFLVPKYADTNGYIFERGQVTLFGDAVSSNCRSVSLLLDLGAVPRMNRTVTGNLIQRVSRQVREDNASICLEAIKKMVAAGYAPTQADLDMSYQWAYDGWVVARGGVRTKGKPNIELSEYLHSLGAQYPSSPNSH